MNHYFNNNSNLKSAEIITEYIFRSTKFMFITDSGVFAKNGVDAASGILLEQLPEITKPGARILDMGCGYGTAGVILSRIYGEDVDVVMADVNRRAVELAKRNLELNGASAEVILSDGFGRLTGSFDYIILNPPIHAGKAVIYRMYEDSREYLNTGGALCLVIRKKHGALSHKQKLGEIFGKQPENLSVLYSKKGIYVFKCVKT